MLARMSKLSTLIELEVPTGDVVPVLRRRFTGGSPGRRVAIVAGIRGDTPEGIRVAYSIAEILETMEKDLHGTVDVYPCVNPLAAHRGSRYWPFFEIDLNRLFPGRADGHSPDRTAFALCEDVRGADQVLELRGAHAAFREAPQALVRVKNDRSAELAQRANVHVVWKRSPGPAAPSTFAHQFPGTIVIEGGAGNRLSQGVGRQLTRGVLSILSTLGVIASAEAPATEPITVTDEQVRRVRAERGGLFLPGCDLWDEVDEGQRIGSLIDPATGAHIQEIASPVTGRVLALREHPVVLAGDMVARVVAT
jgi:predicted deacylase